MAEDKVREETPRDSSAAAIVEALIRDVRVGRYPVDEALPAERVLCERFGSSRPTVREALVQVEARGYARRNSGHRPVAAIPSVEDILSSSAAQFRDLLGDVTAGFHLEQVRRFIEVGALASTCKAMSAPRLQRLHSALLDCHTAIGDEPAFVAADIAFHRVIVEAVDNPIILSLHDRFVRSMLTTRPTVTDRGAHDRLIYDEHRTIYEAIRAQDMDRAVTVLDAHLARSSLSRLPPPPVGDNANPSPSGDGSQGAPGT